MDHLGQKLHDLNTARGYRLCARKQGTTTNAIYGGGSWTPGSMVKLMLNLGMEQVGQKQRI